MAQDRKARIAAARVIVEQALAAAGPQNALKRRSSVIQALAANGYGDIQLYDVTPPSGNNPTTTTPIGFHEWGAFAKRQYRARGGR